MEIGYAAAFAQLNIKQDVFDQIIADEGARGEIYECLMLCLTSVPQLKDVASALLQYIATTVTHGDGGPGSGNWGHEGIPGHLGGSAEGGGKHNRITTKSGGFTSFSKMQKDAARPHKITTEELASLKDHFGRRIVCGGHTLGVATGGTFYSLSTGEVFTHEEICSFEDARVLIPKSESPNKQIRSIKPQVQRSIEEYKTRMQNAFQASTPQEADDELRSASGEIWKSLDAVTKEALYAYTGPRYLDYNPFLRGTDYVGTRTWNDPINRITDAISKSALQKDTVLYRGVTSRGFEQLFGLERGSLSEENISSLVGKTAKDQAFMSAGSCKDRGFSGSKVQIEILAPAGTKALYAEPFSAHGLGSGVSWDDVNSDGVSPQSDFSNELETIIQRGSSIMIMSASVNETGKYRFQAAIVDQNPEPLE